VCRCAGHVARIPKLPKSYEELCHATGHAHFMLGFLWAGLDPTHGAHHVLDDVGAGKRAPQLGRQILPPPFLA